jgi:hypothetical protein
VDKYREYPIVVANMSAQPGNIVNTLARSLFKKLEAAAANDPSVSVSIENLSSNQEQPSSWAITKESTGKITRYLLNEFRVPPTEGPKFVDYFVWISRAPVRAVFYLRSILRGRLGTGPFRQKARALTTLFPRIALLTVLLTVYVLIYSYVLLFISFLVVNPLRRWRLWMLVLYLLGLLLLVFRFAWQSFLPQLVVGMGQFTQGLVSLVNYPKLSFDLLFPVIATVTIAVGISIVTLLIGWLRRAVREVDAWMFTTQGAVDFAFLLDPLYAATARGAFEKRLVEVGNKKETQCVFVICEHIGGLLAYEVLSQTCPAGINKPVHLLTRNLDLAGQSIDLTMDLWLFVEPTDWSRFAKTTPRGLFWRHYSRRLWRSKEFTLRINSAPQGRVPQVQYEIVNKSRFKSSYSMVVDRLITLIDEA